MLVARDWCIFLTVDCANVPKKQRDRFLELAVRRAAPFQAPGFDVAWQGDHAAVWVWPTARVGSLPDAERPPENAAFLAEARHLGAARADAVEALATSGGIDGRVWRDGRLVASRFWRQCPPESEWQLFLRGAGADAGLPLAPVESGSITSRPWDRPTSKTLHQTLLGLGWRTWLTVPTLTAAMAFGLWLGYVVRLGWDISSLRADVERLTRSAGTILDAKERADRARAAIEAHLALRSPIDTTTVADTLATALQGQTWELQNLSVDELGGLAATVRVSAADPAQLVAALEGTGRFADARVEITPNSDLIVLRARTVPMSRLPSSGGGTVEEGAAP